MTKPSLEYQIAALPEGLQTKAAPPFPGSLESLVQEMLSRLGEDPYREGLLRTPDRVARMYAELLSGYHTDLDRLVNGAIFQTDNQDMVIVRGIKFYSLCEHHLLPFMGQAHVAYIPDGKIIGLSKIPRIVEMFARRLQVQERMTHQIAATLEAVLQPRGVAILVEGTHMCSVMRGVKQSDAHMVTSSMLGEFRDQEAMRSDFYHQLKSVETFNHGLDES
jgi:GTP cyclohydrolase I